MSDTIVHLGGSSHRVERDFRDDSLTEQFNVREYIELRRLLPTADADAAPQSELLEVVKPGMFVYGMIDALLGTPYAQCREQLERLPVFYVLEFIETVAIRRALENMPRAASMSENAEALVLRCKPLSELRGGTLRLKTREHAHWTDLVIGDQPFYLPIDSIVTKMPAIIGIGAVTPDFDEPRRVALYATLVDEELEFERGGEILRLYHSNGILRPPFDDAALDVFPGIDAVNSPSPDDPVDDDDKDKDDDDDDDDDDNDASEKQPAEKSSAVSVKVEAAAGDGAMAVDADGAPTKRKRRRRNSTLYFTVKKRHNVRGKPVAPVSDDEEAPSGTPPPRRRGRRRLAATRGRGYVPTSNRRGRSWGRVRGRGGSRRGRGRGTAERVVAVSGLAQLDDAAASTDFKRNIAHASSSSSSSSSAVAAHTASTSAASTTTTTFVSNGATSSALISAPVAYPSAPTYVRPSAIKQHSTPSPSPPPSPTFNAVYGSQRRHQQSTAAPPAQPSNEEVDTLLYMDRVDLSANTWQRFKPQLAKHIVESLKVCTHAEWLYNSSPRVRSFFAQLTRTSLGGEFGAFVDDTLRANPQLAARFLSRFSEPYIRVAHSLVMRPITYRELCTVHMADGVEPISNDILSLALSMQATTSNHLN
jgi:hypothetical protein